MNDWIDYFKDIFVVYEFLCSLKDFVFLGKLILFVYIFRDVCIDMILIWNDIGFFIRVYLGGIF